MIHKKYLEKYFLCIFYHRKLERARKMSKLEKANRICSICGKKYDEYGNNAQPVNDGRCCDECNMKVVIPIRISIHQKITKDT